MTRLVASIVSTGNRNRHSTPFPLSKFKAPLLRLTQQRSRFGGMKMSTSDGMHTHSLAERQQNGVAAEVGGLDEDHSLYERAVFQLNTLQSNAITLAKCQADQRHQRLVANVGETRDCLRILGISLDDIDRLNVVHVTGTKGKGSTAAFLESILRSLGYKTGFYSSPHLVHVRERIRINGQPISERLFTEHFFHLFNTLKTRKPSDQAMPAYFKFLTLLAFRVFIEEQVDVAVVEVGIGGEFDCTNAIQRPIVCAISTLDIDHTKLLGQSLEEIAWHKAGIAKKGAVLLSVEHPEKAMRVVAERCAEKECPLFVIPPLASYQLSPPHRSLHLGIAGPPQHINASLALQSARFWLWRVHERHIELNPTRTDDFADCNTQAKPSLLSGFAIPPGIADALRECRWPARGQLLRHPPNTLFHLDGAHTQQSIQFCAEWFRESSICREDRNNEKRILRVLIFHCTGDRDSRQMLPKFKDCAFDIALFCPARVHSPTQPEQLKSDITNLNLDANTDFSRCDQDKQIWHELNSASSSPPTSEIFACIPDALACVRSLAENNKDAELHVLVTGSLHLCGGVLALLDPNLDNLSCQTLDN